MSEFRQARKARQIGIKKKGVDIDGSSSSKRNSSKHRSEHKKR